MCLPYLHIKREKKQIFEVGNQIKLRVKQQIYFGNMDDAAEWCFVHRAPAGTRFTLRFNYKQARCFLVMRIFHHLPFCLCISLFRLMFNYELIVTPIRCFPVFLKWKHTIYMWVCVLARMELELTLWREGVISLVISALSNKFLFSCAVVMLCSRNKSWIASTSPSLAP